MKWKPGPGARFAPTRQALAVLKREADGMAGASAGGAAHARHRPQAAAIAAHLESYEIANAKIPGVGKAKVATLLSYGIETAADIDEARITAIAGFGPRTAANMLAFRKPCEAAFRFDANRAVEPSHIAAMDGMLAQRRARIEAELARASRSCAPWCWPSADTARCSPGRPRNYGRCMPRPWPTRAR